MPTSFAAIPLIDIAPYRFLQTEGLAPHNTAVSVAEIPNMPSISTESTALSR